jgi:predicted transcriptional regulator
VDGLITKSFKNKVAYSALSTKSEGAAEKMKKLGIKHHGVAVQDKSGNPKWASAMHRLKLSDLSKAIEGVLD